MTFIDELETILEDRKKTLPEGSYATSLYKGGLDRILRKIGEETGEAIIAAKNKDHDELLNELADLTFHILVLLKSENLSFNDVIKVLKSRHK